MLILAIESSCDEFSVALVENGADVLFLKTLSQIELHAQYGGVIPELASREHTKYFLIVLEEINNYLNGDWESIDAIAVTIGPGLAGSLLIGIQLAKVLARLLDKPVIPVHHILGHLFSTNLSVKIEFPYLALIVSGGHTQLVYCADEEHFETIGETQDDAVGEVYDKVAKKLSLPYPGGPLIDKLATQGEVKYHFTSPKIEDDLAFSFSGIKSAVINLINTQKQKDELIVVADIAASFQSFVVEELIKKIKIAIEKYPVKTVGLSGGVSANLALRTQFMKLQSQYSEKLFVIPEMKYCGDNAAMIGAAAYFLTEISNSQVSNRIECYPNVSIADFMKMQQEFKHYEGGRGNEKNITESNGKKNARVLSSISSSKRTRDRSN